MRAIFVLMLLSCGDDRPGVPDLHSSVCRFSSGRVCGYDSLGGCPADDPCNWCDCVDSPDHAACTLVGCFLDGGATVARCQSTAECPTGAVCVFDPGCDKQPGRCTGAIECTSGSPARYCGCDGKPFMSVGPCADQPHSGRGGC
jgi:hypothetical protein